ncbi:MAG: hypothetical protein AAGB22_00200, partial [Bacteroidota bacterium]
VWLPEFYTLGTGYPIHSPNFSHTMSQSKYAHSAADTGISNTPDLPAINWSLLGAKAPTLINSEPNYLEAADAVVIVYAEAEWAALEQVFCNSANPMPYSARNTSYWEGWHEFKQDIPGGVKDWTYWFYYRLVEIEGKKVYLVKSNTHLDHPGEGYLEKMIQLMIDYIQPQVILSTGTAGGAMVSDHIGTVNITNAGALYSAKEPHHEWPVYANDWRANLGTVHQDDFNQLLFPIPTTEQDLEALVTQFNTKYKTDFTLADLNPGNVDMGADKPGVHDFTPTSTPLCTSDSFVIATSAGNFNDYVCMEMDDAIVGKVCNNNKTPFGFVRNISDPVQAAGIGFEHQKNWGGSLYSSYGFYTSYNSALVSWALLYAAFRA